MNVRAWFMGIGVRLKRNGLWLTAVLSVGVFVGLVVFAEATAVAAAFAAFEWRIFLVVLMLATTAYVLRFLRWEFYLRTLSIDIPLRVSAVVFFSGLMFVVTPGKVGELWKSWFMKDLQGVPASRVTSVVGADRLTDFLALGLMASLGPLVYGRSIALIVIVFVTVGLGIGLLQWRSACLRLLSVLESAPVVNKYARAAEELYESSQALFKPRPLGVAMVLSTAAWTIEATALWVILYGFGIPGSVFQSVFVYGFGLVIGAVSMLPGGLGVAEASMVGLLLSFGYERSVAVSTVLILRAGTLWYAVLLGLTVYVQFTTKLRLVEPKRDD